MSYLLRHNASNGHAHGAPATPLIVTPFGTVLIRKDNINPLSSVKRVLISDRCKILVWQGILYIYIRKTVVLVVRLTMILGAINKR